jgi:hypothetical protein
MLVLVVELLQDQSEYEWYIFLALVDVLYQVRCYMQQQTTCMDGFNPLKTRLSNEPVGSASLTQWRVALDHVITPSEQFLYEWLLLSIFKLIAIQK